MRTPNAAARVRRKNMPDAERILWSRLKNKQLGGFRFRRQHTIGPYIADFACIEARLVVELDGGRHGKDDAPARDAARNAYMEDHGWMVIRFWNHEVFKRLNDVLGAISYAAEMGALRLRMIKEGRA